MTKLPEDGSAHAMAALVRYIDHCELVGLNARHITQKQSHIRKFAAELQTPMNQWVSDDLLRSMRALITNGLSPRTANFRRQLLRAFTAWCVGEQILGRDPFARTPSINEHGERRYRRRALTDDEISLLLCAAERIGVERLAWYATALYAGLRRSELIRLQWKDVDLERRIVTVRGGKSGRLDSVPICDCLAQCLDALTRGRHESTVFKAVSHGDRRIDFDRAGIIHIDLYGCVVDLHSLRRTLHMRLVRSGVMPQVAQRLMRHSDYRTTLKFYTDDLQRDGRDALEVAFGVRAGARTRASECNDHSPRAWKLNYDHTITFISPIYPQ